MFVIVHTSIYLLYTLSFSCVKVRRHMFNLSICLHISNLYWCLISKHTLLSPALNCIFVYEINIFQPFFLKRHFHFKIGQFKMFRRNPAGIPPKQLKTPINQSIKCHIFDMPCLFFLSSDIHHTLNRRKSNRVRN